MERIATVVCETRHRRSGRPGAADEGPHSITDDDWEVADDMLSELEQLGLIELADDG